MKKEDFHKYLYAGLTAFAVVVCSILFFYVLYNTKNISDIVDKFVGILMPFIIGAVIAYLLTPVSNRLSKYVMRLLIRISGEDFEDMILQQKQEEEKEAAELSGRKRTAEEKGMAETEKNGAKTAEAKDEEIKNKEIERKEIKNKETQAAKTQRPETDKKPFRSKIISRILSYKKTEESEYIAHRRKYKKLESFADGISIILALLIAIAVIYMLLAMVIPEVIISMNSLIEAFPSSVSDLKKLLSEQFRGNEVVYNYLMQFMDMMNGNIEEFLSKYLLPNMQSLMTKVYSGVFSAIGVVKNLLIGIIISVYLMGRRKQFMAQGILLLRSICNEKISNAILEELDIANNMFGGFIRGKLVDSLLIGIICFACMSVFRMPYALLISVIIGVTNIIPFFGPFIGAVPSAFLVLIADSGEINIAGCIYFLIFILILQQFDGNVLGPKILGNSTGLSSFWVLFSILLFGGLFGVIGMVIGVPLFAVIYDMIKKFVEKSLERKGRSEEMEQYEKKFHGAE